jgi:thiol-disulfide isomerase/thioredoxin
MGILSTIYLIGRFLYDYKIVLLITSVFLILTIYYYQQIVAPKLNKKYVENKEFITDTQVPKTATLYYFYTTWCPLCKKATPEIRALESQINGMVKGVSIVLKEIDCDKDSALADEYNVTGYPTIKLIYDNKTYDYDAKPDKGTLIQFLNTVIEDPTDSN